MCNEYRIYETKHNLFCNILICPDAAVYVIQESPIHTVKVTRASKFKLRNKKCKNSITLLTSKSVNMMDLSPCDWKLSKH